MTVKASVDEVKASVDDRRQDEVKDSVEERYSAGDKKRVSPTVRYCR